MAQQRTSQQPPRRKTFRTASGSTAVLFLEDCIRGIERELEEKAVDVVVTSPPYNIGKKYGAHRDNLPRGEYLDWMERVSVALRGALRDDGSFFLNVGATPTDPWIAWDIALRLRGHYVLQNVIHWIKSIAIRKRDVGDYPNIRGDIAVGHFKPIVSERFLNDCHEYVFHFTKAGDVKLDKLSVGIPYQDKSNIGRWSRATRDIRDKGNTWFLPYETIQDRAERPHPATFPVSLPEACIKLHGPKRRRGRPSSSSFAVVVDPFLGIGASAIAATRLGVDFVGFEVDRAYFDEACRRLSQVATPIRGANR